MSRSPAGPRLGQAAHALVTAGLAVILRAARFRRVRGARDQRRALARHRLATARAALDAARAGQQRRLAEDVREATDGPLRQLTAAMAELPVAFATGVDEARRALAECDGAIGALSDRCRRLARASYPVTLRSAGPSVALRELAGELSNEVVVGDCADVCAGWAVESVLFRALSVALRWLDRWPVDRAAEIHWAQTGDQAHARLRMVRADEPGPADRLSLATGIACSVELVQALGGAVGIGLDGRSVRIDVAVPLSLNAPHG